MIEIVIDTPSDEIILPIAPEEIEVTVPGNTESVDIIGIGEVKILHKPGLSTFVIDSFIPDDEDGEDFIDAVNSWMESGKPGDFNAGDIGLNMNVAIEDFTYSRRAGEEDRVYYTLSLTEYRPYGARIIAQPQEPTSDTGEVSATVMEEPRVDNSEPVQSTYTVKSGNSLWSISKSLSGNGANWKALYEVNREVIGNNPDRIYPGQILTIPKGW